MINTNDPTLYEPLQRQLVLPLFSSSSPLWGRVHEFNPHLSVPLLLRLLLLLHSSHSCLFFFFFVGVFQLSGSDHLPSSNRTGTGAAADFRARSPSFVFVNVVLVCKKKHMKSFTACPLPGINIMKSFVFLCHILEDFRAKKKKK